MQEKLAQLLSRKLAGEASVEELKELEDWMKQHPEDGYFIELMQLYWKPNNTPLLSEDRTANIFNEIIAASQEGLHPAADSQPFFTWKKILLAAACIAGIWLSWNMLVPSAPIPELRQLEVSTYRGARSHILLPDGSKVWLNSDSKLYYDSLFTGDFREVTLTGEAFFDVVANKDKPFVVKTGDYSIRVLGTAFNVKSYALDSVMETTLIRGKVEVHHKTAAMKPAVLLPNQKLRLPASLPAKLKDEEPFLISLQYNPAKKEEEAMPETAWVYNRLVFEETSFKDLALKLERWFDVRIAFADDQVTHYRLSGSFEEESIDEVLTALQEIVKFKFKTNERDILISK